MTNDPLLDDLIRDGRKPLEPLPTPIGDALNRPEGFEFGATPSGVHASGTKSLGHDVTVTGEASKSYARRAWEWMVGVRWSPK